jgi:hypothetical protein
MIVLALSLSCTIYEIQAGEQNSIPIMPQELVELAQQYGYDQVDDFYMNRPGGVNPCYVYDFLPLNKPYEEFMSAVFWCKKSGPDEPIYCLFFARREHPGGYLQKYDIIENTNFPRGLSLHKDNTLTLDKYVYLNSNEKGPKGVHLEGNIIRSEYDGVVTDFYNYEGEWLIRVMH